MQTIIHRGHDQIGGAIVEISTKNAKILIDFGEELSLHQEIDMEAILRNCDAIIFTHYHSDHIGLYKSIPPSIPVYLGWIAKRIFGTLVARTDPGNQSHVERFTYNIRRVVYQRPNIISRLHRNGVTYLSHRRMV